MRVRERYWHEQEEPTSSFFPVSPSTHPILLIPDALTIRMYAPSLFQELSQFHWIITESAIEYMDYRNQSCSEAAAPQERTRLIKFIETSRHVSTFCDLSVRTVDDEFDFMNYETLEIEQRAKMALLRAARMFLPHHDRVIVVSDNITNSDDVEVQTMEEILQFLSTVDNNSLSDGEVERLREFQRTCRDRYEDRNRSVTANKSTILEVSLSEKEIEEGLRNKSLYQGKLMVASENCKEAYVTVESESYFVDINKGHHRRSIHGDTVIIQLLTQEHWGRPIGRRKLVHRTNDSDDFDDYDGDPGVPPFPSARVVSTVASSYRKYVCTLVNIPHSDESAVLVVPRDIRIPKIRIKTHSWQSFVGKRILCEIDGWKEGSSYPHGRCLEIIGEVGDLDTEISCLMMENQIFLDKFSAAALACLPVEDTSWAVPHEEIKRRSDLRFTRRIFSVDPPGCQDIDDAMHAEILENGDIEVGVHIADVTYFLSKDSALDLEAQRRGTTFYLVDRRFDMLPSLLSSNLCSLHEKVDRLAVSVTWVFSSDFRTVKACYFGRSVIRNCASMTYDQAESILLNQYQEPGIMGTIHPSLTAGAPVDLNLIPLLRNDLQILTDLARHLKSIREKSGAIDLSGGEGGSELKFDLENGFPKKVTPKSEREIHHTIAELMILANGAVAAKIFSAIPNGTLLRVHRPASIEMLGGLERLLGTKVEPTSLNKCLKLSEKATDRSIYSLIQAETTRAMTEALYLRSGTADNQKDLSHFGLGIPKYTHFTSPIRRYADVIVHRQLLSVLLQEKSTPTRLLLSNNTKRLELVEVPTSEIESILEPENDLVPSSGSTPVLTDQLTELSLGETPGNFETEESPEIYESKRFDSICDRLNHHNRLAKMSSRECQQLFLSIFFRDSSEYQRGVILETRENGFIAYVPRYDLRVPVYLIDRDGIVQMDPHFFQLEDDAGQEADKLFSSSPFCRLLGPGVVERRGTDLVVSVPLSPNKVHFSQLSVVTLHLSCSRWDTSARMPPLRADLVRGDVQIPIHGEKIDKTGVVLDQDEEINVEQKRHDDDRGNFYSSIFRCQRSSCLKEDLLVKPEIVDPENGFLEASGLPGRISCWGFKNPDTRAALQEAARNSSSLKSARNALLSSSQTERKTGELIAREVTARQQRIAAAKRNTRKSKMK